MACEGPWDAQPEPGSSVSKTGIIPEETGEMDGSTIYLWLAAFLDGITGENGSFRDGTPDPFGGIRQGIVFKTGIITRRKIS